MAVVSSLVVAAARAPYHGPHLLETGHKVGFGVISFGAGDQYPAGGVPCNFATNLGMDYVEHLVPLQLQSFEDDVSVADAVSPSWDEDAQTLRLFQTAASNAELNANDVIQDVYFEVMAFARSR